jgi:CelD/BcsL family acetyltransferase involved in cellulose biosynthesis
MDVDQIETTDGLIALRDEWASLWSKAPDVTPFQHPDWLTSWWITLGTGTLRVTTLREQGRLVGLLPLFQTNGRGAFLGVGVTDYLDVLLHPECSQEDLRASLRGWTCELDCLRESSPMLRVGGQVCASHISPVLALPGSIEVFERTLSSQFRKHLRQAETALRRLGDVTVEVATPHNYAEALDVLFQLHRKRWSVRNDRGVMYESGVQQFHHRIAAAWSALGMLRLYTMSVAAFPASSLYALASGTEFYFYIGGFDPEFARASPGSLLILHAIRDAIAAGCTAFHFLRGNETYKYRWNATDRQLWRVSIQS